MDIILQFKTVFFGMLEVFFLGLIGFIIVKRRIINQDGLDMLSRLVVEVLLPALMFSTLIKNFDFRSFSNWWMWPVSSFAIFLLAFIIGFFFSKIASISQKKEFMGLVSFQNSGNIVLPLLAAMLPKEELNTAFIYVFLFLFGFNIVMWSVGPYMIAGRKDNRFRLGSLFSPPFIAIIIAFILLLFKLNRFIPDVILRPITLVGSCTIPFAVIVVGGILATVSFERGKIDIPTFINLVLVKLIVIPLVTLAVLWWLRLPHLVGLIILIEAAVPSANSLAIIARYYDSDYRFISQGIFITHIVSLITIPLFIALFYLVCV